jgi:hypothetical protein
MIEYCGNGQSSLGFVSFWILTVYIHGHPGLRKSDIWEMQIYPHLLGLLVKHLAVSRLASFKLGLEE